ncbi:hypothetical protein LEP1GSC049_0029 [Leptospira kirschneri serovar Cynopteri str. 3522 CT]|nr:hypothetical protein LEP1GSC049_0029 [Leptospira kirschneri serovar Cynopteri str. 3522 CT]
MEKSSLVKMESINWPLYNQLESPETIPKLFERTQTNAK